MLQGSDETSSDDGASTAPTPGVEPPRSGDTPTSRVVGTPVAQPAPETARLYAAEWSRFVAWCRDAKCTSLPASDATFAAYLMAAAPGLGRGALGRCRAAIGTMHRQSGLSIPLLDAVTQKALRANTRPRNPSRPVGPTSNDLRRLASKCPRDLPGLRDRALLLLVAALARPGHRTTGDLDGIARDRAAVELVPRLLLLALDAEQVRFTVIGMTLQLRSRTDETAPSRDVNLTRAMTAETCAVRAMEDWLRASDTAFGPVFRKIDRWGNVEHGRMHADAWNRILARRDGVRRSRQTAREDR